MKRGKDDEKILEPLFPKLHVNDADKGGPRAPPRNKMALYEQLSIPSQRFSQQEMAPHNVSDTGSLVPPGPSNKACGTEINQYFHHQVYSSSPMQQVEKFVPPKSCMANVRSLAQHDQSKMAGEEDDFMVPVFLNSGRAQSNDRTKSGVDYEKISPVVVASCLQLVEILEENVKDPKNGLMTVSSKQEVRNLGKENPRQSTVLKSADLAKEEINVSKSVSKRERRSNAHLRQESRNRLDQDDGETFVKGTDISQLRCANHSGKGVTSPDLVENDHNRCRSRACISLHHGNGEASDGVSETSMVDSISSTDISPDDVVRIIGQKRFWKARRAIANQQRVFAVQVFELHRLIKVQRLMAASSHLLLEDGTFVGKFSPKTSPVKKNLLGEYVVKPLPGVAKSKDDSEKNNLHKMECSAENGVERTPSVSSSKNHNNNNNSNHHQPSNFIPFVANNNPPARAATETQMTVTSGDGGSWCFPPQPHPGNHQWLIPVMSPSEGLVYKPYPNPGSLGSGCGEYYGQFIPAPMAVGNFMGGPVYGIPTPPPYHPGVGFPLPGPGYFSPYAVATMDQNISGQQNTEKMSQFRHLGNTQQQSSCNFPNSNINVKAVAPPQPCQPVTKPCQWNKESSMVLQGSTGNNPTERGGSVVVDMSGNTLPPLPTKSAADNSRRNKHLLMPPKTATRMMTGTEVATTAKVIRVVPHNPKATSESAARIFRSIQEERKQYEFSA